MPWRELTTSREERLSLLRLSRGAKEEDESQLTTSREERLSKLRLSRGAKEEDESQNEGKASVVNPLPRCCNQRWRKRESAGGTEYIKKEEHEKDNNPRVYGMAHHTIIRPDRPAMDS